MGGHELQIRQHRQGIAVAEHQVDGALQVGEGVPGIPFANPHKLDQTGFAQMAAGARSLGGHRFRADHRAAAILTHGQSQIDRGDAKGCSKLHNFPGPQSSGQQISEDALAPIQADELVLQSFVETLQADAVAQGQPRQLIQKAPEQAEGLLVRLVVELSTKILHLEIRQCQQGIALHGIEIGGGQS